MYCWNINWDCNSIYTRGVTSIIWRLEKHSACMLVKKQPATRAQEDLVSTYGQVKLTQFWLVWFLFVSKGHTKFVLLRTKYFFTFHVEHVSTKFCSSWHLCHSILEHLEFPKHWSQRWAPLNWSFSFPRLLHNLLSLRYWWNLMTYMNALMKSSIVATYRSSLRLPDCWSRLLQNIFARLQEGILGSLESLRFYTSTKHDGKGGY